MHKYFDYSLFSVKVLHWFDSVGCCYLIIEKIKFYRKCKYKNELNFSDLIKVEDLDNTI